MKRNAIMPYVWIMILGIGLMFGLGFKGLSDAKQIASEGENEEQVDDTKGAVGGPEELYAGKCSACHGDQYQGTVGPALTNLTLSEDEIKDILVNGKGTMPDSLVPDDQLDEMAAWLLELK